MKRALLTAPIRLDREMLKTKDNNKHEFELEDNQMQALA